MLAEYVKYTGILISKILFYRVTDINIALTETKLSTHFRIHPDIQFCYMDMLYDFLVERNSVIHFFLRWPVNIVVSLHTDTVDGHTSSLHRLHHIEDALALDRIRLIVVVVEQQCLRVGLMCKLESLGNKLVTTEFIHWALTVGVDCILVVCHRLVHYIPTVHHIFITVHHRLNMILHTGIEHLFCGIALEHPLTNL